MSKTSFILFLLLFIVLGIFLSIHYSSNKTLLPTINSAQNTPPADTSEHAATTLALRAKPVIGQTVQVDVVLNAVTAMPTIAQMEIGYDPTMLTLVQVLPGSYFNKPKVLLNSTLPRTGRMTYALSCSDEKNCINDANDAVIATITYAVNPFAQKKETQIDILPKTLLRTEDDKEVLLQVKGTKVTLPSIVAPPASPSGVALLQ